MGDLRATAEELRKIIEQFIDAGEVKTAKGFLERWLSVAVAARLQENGIQCSLDDALHTAGLEEDETILARFPAALFGVYGSALSGQNTVRRT